MCDPNSQLHSVGKGSSGQDITIYLFTCREGEKISPVVHACIGLVLCEGFARSSENTAVRPRACQLAPLRTDFAACFACPSVLVGQYFACSVQVGGLPGNQLHTCSSSARQRYRQAYLNCSSSPCSVLFSSMLSGVGLDLGLLHFEL